MLRLALCLFALPVMSMAQEISFSPDATNACIRNGGGTECIGTSAERCMEDSAAGYSTVGVNACFDYEYKLWDGLLNRVYGQLMERETGLDAEGAKLMPDRPSGADALRQAQRAWIAYRDATCAYEELQWYGGTGALGAYLSCMTRTTGEQALFLQATLDAG